MAADNTIETAFSKIFYVIHFVLITVVVIALGQKREVERREEKRREEKRTDEQVQNAATKQRLRHLDFARITCVMCVVNDHCGGQTYAFHNVGFCLQWVLPFVCITSGMCLMLSKSTLRIYVCRLSIVFAIGVSLNWISLLYANKHDGSNPDSGAIVFHMAFVLMLISGAISTAPLRRTMKGEGCRWELPVMTAFFGIVCIVGLLLVCSGGSIDFCGGFCSGPFPTVHVVDFAGMLFFSSLANLVKCESWVGWILLELMYLPHIIVAHPTALSASPRTFQWYIFGLVTQHWPLKGRDSLASYMRQYWPFVLIVLLLLYQPDMVGRCDLNVPRTHWERFRFYAIEFVLVVAFVSGAMRPSDPWKVTAWLTPWALFAYVSHMLWYRLLPQWGAAITFGFIPIFFAVHALTIFVKRKRKIDPDMISVMSAASDKEELNESTFKTEDNHSWNGNLTATGNATQDGTTTTEEIEVEDGCLRKSINLPHILDTIIQQDRCPHRIHNSIFHIGTTTMEVIELEEQQCTEKQRQEQLQQEQLQEQARVVAEQQRIIAA
jgi:hypothetical protein